MKCKHCGGRSFNLIERCVVKREYDEFDNIASNYVDQLIQDEPDTHYCYGCAGDIKDEDLILEQGEDSDARESLDD